MNSFDFDISEKDLAGADYVVRAGRALVAAFVRKARQDHITKAELARRLDLDKAVVSRMLQGNANMTLRSVGELCWALGIRPDLVCADEPQQQDRLNVAQIRVAPTAAAAQLVPPSLQVSAQ